MDKLERINATTERIIQAAIQVHKALGPGLLESAYEACLHFELTKGGMKAERQKALPVIYRDVKLDCGYRLDLVVEDLVIVEIKALSSILPIHRSQLLSYLRLSRLRVGLLIDFHVPRLHKGISRVVNGY